MTTAPPARATGGAAGIRGYGKAMVATVEL